MTNERLELLRRVMKRTMAWNFRIWGFGEAVALRGLLRGADLVGDAEARGFVHGLVRAWIGRGAARSWEDHVAPGRELLLLYEATGDPVLLETARRLAELHAACPAPPSGARRHRPDQPGWRGQIWVDCMDVDAPFLVRLAKATGDAAYADQAANELLGYCRELQDEETGLFWHGAESDCGRCGQLWARGNGWAIMGLVDTLVSLSSAHPAFAELKDRLVALCDGLRGYQHEGGLWRTIITHPEAYLETTLAAMAGCALREAFDRNLLPPERFADMERRARAAAIGQIEADGGVKLVSDATPVAEERSYLTRPFGVFPWGQGPVLLCLVQDFR